MPSLGQHGTATAFASAITSAAVTTQNGSTFLVYGESGSITSVSDSKGNSYGLKKTISGAGGAVLNVYECLNGVGGAGHTFTVNYSGSANRRMFFLEVVPSSGSLTADVNTSLADTSSPFTITSGTLADAAELAVLIAVSDTATSSLSISDYNESTGFTVDDFETDASARYGVFGAHKSITGTGSFTPSWTCTGGSTAVSILATYYESGSAGTTYTETSGDAVADVTDDFLSAVYKPWQDAAGIKASIVRRLDS